MPVVATAAALTAEIRSDSTRSEHDWTVQFILVLPRARHRSPALFFVGDRSNKLAVAVPAALANVDLVAIAQSIRTFFIPPVIMFRFATWRFAVDFVE